jgi:hypothetical protein
MIIVGTVIVLAIFLVIGWAIATEMFQQRAWRKRAEEGDPDMVRALLDEAFASWQRARPPRGLPAHLWAGVQGAQIVATTEDSAQVSSSAEGEFRSEDGRRVQVSTALDEAMALAAKLVDMLLYDVPNLRLASVRVDIYSTFTGSDGTPVQQPILTTLATRADAEDLVWEAMSPAEVLGRFETRYERSPTGQATPLELDPFLVAEAV